MPLHANHLKSLMELAHLGAIIAPPTPAFYLHPKTIDEMVQHTLNHVLKYFIDLPEVPGWKNEEGEKSNG
jgi:flavin prenyltransferase